MASRRRRIGLIGRFQPTAVARELTYKLRRPTLGRNIVLDSRPQSSHGLGPNDFEILRPAESTCVGRVFRAPDAFCQDPFEWGVEDSLR